MSPTRTFWTITLSAAAILAVTMGIRQSLGLFVSPLNTATGLGIVSISFAMAVGQFTWGLAQPIFGILADRVGSFKAIALGTMLMALGLAVTPYMSSDFGLTMALGVMMAAGAGAGSFSILIGAAAQKVSPEKRSMAAGIINAGGSFGQFIFAPVTQALIHALNWVGALWALAATSLSAILLALPLREKKAASTQKNSLQQGLTLRQQLNISFRDRSYWCLHAGFFTCGFHIAFLVTHLPGEVNLCGLTASVGATSLAIIGLSNVFGSLYAGWLGQHHRMKIILFWMYASRALIVAIYLLAPKTELTFYVFAAALGFTWLSTVPPTSGLVGKLFGPRYLATLFGLTLLSHQIGGFLGAWLGGIAFYSTGNYEWMWGADIALALLAAALNLPIRESHPVKDLSLAQ
ncbi:Predicted arabinose efflux permease, MFS family [Methylobacillus rhizosphaerae]|uniref:Predicted arabinose efflux permease, MFS family n=1 Tax=Methylobacillus rhizosphaerae TaxID=551994 RepID=A0A239B1R8_9PROT|nr:MFS transporter [Methylobacillus rhizosphaerae]SNS01571.1 Predicted arabinose efflux permease, MFS family [Methylobacillus rhizosphaerae]